MKKLLFAILLFSNSCFSQVHLPNAKNIGIHNTNSITTKGLEISDTAICDGLLILNNNEIRDVRAIQSTAGFDLEDFANGIIYSALDLLPFIGTPYRQFVDSSTTVVLDLQHGVKMPALPSGAGMKALRYNTTTKAITIADTTAGGGTTTDTLKNGLWISSLGFNGSANANVNVDSAAAAAYLVRRKDSIAGGYYPYYSNPKGYLTSQTTDWHVTGNSGTNSGSFIGTTDSPFVYMRTAGNSFGIFRSDSNRVALGTFAATGNTGAFTDIIALGNLAVQAATGNNSIGIGVSALQGSSGTNKIAIGALAGQSNTGSEVIGVGHNSINSNTGNYVVGIGYQSANINTFNQVVALGSDATPTASNQFYLSDSCTKAVMKLNGGSPNSILTNDGSGNVSWQTAGGGSGWSLTGNANTNPATDFIGTTDSALVIKAVGQRAGYLNYHSFPNIRLTYYGIRAGGGSTAAFATAIGVSAGVNNTKDNATQVGDSAGSGNTGDYFTVIGSEAGLNNSGNRVTIVGRSAGIGNTGTDLAAFGEFAANGNTASEVTAIGQGSATNNTGSDLTAVGVDAGQGNTASQFTVIGRNAGINNTSVNAQCYGAYSQVLCTNCIVFGDTATNHAVGFGYATPDALLFGNGGIAVSGDVFANGVHFSIPNIPTDSTMVNSNEMWVEGLTGILHRKF